MKNILKLHTLLFIVIASAFFACDEDPTDDLNDIIKDDLGYVPKIARFTLIAPATSTVPAGSNVSVDLRYWSEGTISNVQFFLVQGTTETKITEQPYAPAFSKITKTDSLIFTYQVPALASGTAFSIQARVINEGLEDYPTKSAVALKIQ
jgi:hypothetical protein